MRVLCLGTAGDRTFVHTLEALKESGARFDAIDLAQLAFSGEMEIPLGEPRETRFHLHNESYRMGDYRSIFLRIIGLSQEAPSDRLRRRSAAQYAALSQLLSRSPVPVVNPPFGDNSNAAKLFHATALAPILGMPIPRSCLTDSPQEARAFIAACSGAGRGMGGVIFKGGSGSKTWARLFDPDRDASRLDLLPGCPVLFQERIEGPDVRIHTVGGECFAEWIDSPEPDYRKARGNAFKRLHDLPPAVAAGCTELARVSGKPFLGIDFKIQRRTGEWFFLEANPQPGYDYYDIRMEGAISKALIRYLQTVETSS